MKVFENTLKQAKESTKQRNIERVLRYNMTTKKQRTMQKNETKRKDEAITKK